MSIVRLWATGDKKLSYLILQSAIRSRVFDSEMAAYLCAHAGTIYHPCGTCRMGQDGRSVVDPALNLRGLKGLRVADASIMPAVTSGNLNAPCMMIGEKAAELMLSSR